MSRPIAAVIAYCAIGPNGLIDLDMVRRSDAAARWAAGNVEGMAWPALERSGWRVVPVRVSVVLPGEEEVPSRVVEQPRALKAALPGDFKPAPKQGAADENRMKLLRVGEIG